MWPRVGLPSNHEVHQVPSHSRNRSGRGYGFGGHGHRDRCWRVELACAGQRAHHWRERERYTDAHRDRDGLAQHDRQEGPGSTTRGQHSASSGTDD